MIRVGALPILVSKESASECAGSVDITSVRLPAFAERTAVAAATVVLPTPPLPVKRMTRIRAAYLAALRRQRVADRKSTRLNSSHQIISYAVFCLKKKKNHNQEQIVRMIAYSQYF